jgi:uncharacterized protein YaiI (UPF0178 family)
VVDVVGEAADPASVLVITVATTAAVVTAEIVAAVVVAAAAAAMVEDRGKSFQTQTCLSCSSSISFPLLFLTDSSDIL